MDTEQINLCEDIIKNLFTGKYDKQTILKNLAKLEFNKPIFTEFVKEHQPNYYNEPWNEVDKFRMVTDLGYV